MTDDAPRSGWRAHGAAAVLFVLLTIAHTWPLATGPGTLSRNDNGDALLNEWIVAWVAHQLPRDPLHLFQGNIFYPAKDTLAFSEPLIVPALMAAPALWLGASPVLAHNLLLLAGFALTGFATYLVAWAWTGNRLAAIVAGSLVAFNTQTMTRTAHLQAQHAYGLPLALFFADRVITAPGMWPSLGLAASMTALAYTSGYLFVFASVMVAVVVFARVPDWRGNAPKVLSGFVLATIVAAVLVLPLYLPYRRAAIEQGMVRSLHSASEYSATLKGYLAAAGHVHVETWSGRFFKDSVDAFFPGVTAIVLSGFALAAIRRRETRARTIMVAAIAATGFVLSLGPATPIYRWLFAVFPPMQGLRAAARFGGLFLMAIAFLSALGLAAIGRRWPRAAVATGIAAIAAVNIEALHAPLELRRFDGIPRIYDLLAREPGPVVLAETPFYPPHAAFENAEYVLNSTAHWRPLMNGYSGYTPASYAKIAWTFWYFPEERAIAAMREAGVTHVTVHPARFGNQAAKTIEILSHRSDFELLAIGARNGIRLYRLR